VQDLVPRSLLVEDLLSYLASFLPVALLAPYLPQRLRQKTNNVGRHGMTLIAEDDALVAEAVAYRFDTTKPGLISSAINHSVRRQKPLSWLRINPCCQHIHTLVWRARGRRLCC
jgi:hypothetical protein